MGAFCMLASLVPTNVPQVLLYVSCVHVKSCVEPWLGGSVGWSVVPHTQIWV